MAVTITVTSPTGSEFALADWLLNADVVNPLVMTAGEYRLATTGTFLGGAIELRFFSSGNDIIYDGVYPDGGTFDSLQIFSVDLNMVVITVTGFVKNAQQLVNGINNNLPDLTSFIFDQNIEYNGGAGPDNFKAYDSNSGFFYNFNTINGGDGADKLFGSHEIDTLNGGDGDDVLAGGGDADVLNGGNGFDTADYSNEGSNNGLGIIVDVPGNYVLGGDGGQNGDGFSSIERFIGTKHSDKFYGDASFNFFEGRDGKDEIYGAGGDDWAIGGAGADLMDGGDGIDTLAYLGAVAGVTVTLGAPNAWSSGSGGDAQGDKIRNFENIIGGDGNDRLTGNALDNRLFGTKGNDLLFGMAGNDKLNGGEGIDTIDGGAGDDLIEGGTGADNLTGGTGIDTVSYESSTAAVTVNLLTNVNKGGDAEGDKLFTVENIIGSKFDDVITGNSADNVFEGGEGADTITGSGKDIASYMNSADAVQIDLSIGGAAQTSTGDGNGDKLIGILNLFGSTFDDKLTGDANDNVIEGGIGADEMDGGLGNDTLSYATSNAGVGIQLDANGAGTGSGGHAQNDTYKNFENVIGSDYDDSITGNNIANKLTGGKGDDFIEGYGGADIIDGGDGIDAASYENSDAGVTVNLTSGIHTGGHAQGDKLTSIENLFGSEFKDKLTGNSVANYINGGNDDDYIDGASGNDTLHGGSGIDTILGGAGDDHIEGGANADIIDGGAGIDTLSYASSGAVKVKLGEGSAAQVQSAATKVTVNGVANIELGGNDAEGDSVKNFENLIGSAFNDVLIGNSLANRIEGGIGKDNIDGGKGNDTIFGGVGDDTIFGGDGDDVIEGGAGADKLDGGAGKNTLSYAGDMAGVDIDLSNKTNADGDAAGDIIVFASFQNVRGGSGNDYFVGNSDVNVLEGGSGDDTLLGMGGKDVLDGGDGFDTANFFGVTAGVTVTLGANGAATKVTGAAGVGSAAGTTIKNIEGLIGTALNDKLGGNALDNFISGGDGDDWIIGDLGQDNLDGAGGIDTLSYANSKAAVTVTINGSNITGGQGGDAAADIIWNFENLVGSKYDDILTSTAAAQANVIKGGAGNDIIEGGAGADMLYGEAGADTLSYKSDSAGVVVVLKGSAAADVSGSVNAGNHAAGDVAIGFENLSGGVGVDVLTGDAGANIIDGYGGDDKLDGMGGIDTVSYASAGGKVTVKLGDNGAETTGNGEAGENDSIKNFENIVGSEFGDNLHGNNLANALFGGKGDDTLIGGGGADKFDGGDHFDTVDYSMLTAAQSITVTLGKDGKAATVSSPGGSPASGDVLINIESIKGGAGNDKLTGNNLYNELYGGDGDDYLQAGISADLLNGGNGNDTASFVLLPHFVNADLATGTVNGTNTLSAIENLIGTNFNDILTGDAGVNQIFGGAGDDTIRGGDGADFLDGGTQSSNKLSQNFIGDIVDYSGISDLNVFVTLGNGSTKTTVTATGLNASFANGEVIMNFESVLAGDGDDKLIGNSGNNALHGGQGDDWIEGGTGDDFLDGGSGTNTVSYAGATAGVTVNLNIVGAQKTGGAGIDWLSNFQNIVGSAKNDVLTGDSLKNHIEGGEGNDIIEGGYGGDTLHGGNGIDTVSYATSQTPVTVDLNLQDGFTIQNGGVGDSVTDILTGFENLIGSLSNDTLIGDVNKNVISGLDGDDTIDGGREADILDGGAGIDTLSYEGDNNAVTVKLGTNGAQTLVTGLSHGTGDKVSNFENIKGGMGNDILAGNNLANKIWGGDGNDIIDGGLGDDWMDGGSGINTLSFASVNVSVTVNLGDPSTQNTGAGNDTFLNFLNLLGSSKDDTLSGNATGNLIEGGAGNDTIFGLAGNDILEGGAGNDIIDGGANIDTASYANAAAAVTVDLSIAGPQNTKSAGIDTLISIEGLLGSKFNDKLIGDGGANTLDGGAGNDILIGGAGNDTLIGGVGNDILDGGNDNDVASYVSATAGVTVSLELDGVAQNTGGAGIDTLISIERIAGSDFNDTLTGKTVSEIYAGGGDDTLIMSGSNNVMLGGAGDDSFRFNTVTIGDHVIIDFGDGADKVQISKSGFGIPSSVALGGSGADDFAAEYFVSGSGAVATKAHGQFVFDTDTFKLYWDADGTGGGTAVMLVDFVNDHNLLATDFTLI